MILITLLGRMIVLQFVICMAIIYLQFIHKNIWSAMENTLAGMTVICAMEFMIILANFGDDVIFVYKQRNILQFSNLQNFKQFETLFFQKRV